MSSSFAGRRALVTAATAGLGEDLAGALVALGASVVVNGRSPEKVAATEARVREHGPNAHGVVADIATWDGCQSLADRCVKLLGGLDLVCISTAGPPEVGDLRDATDAGVWMAAFERQALPVAFLLEALVPVLRKGTDPAVAVISSGSVKEPMARHVHSTVPRAGVTAMVQALARRFDDVPIRANLVSPVSIETPAFRQRQWPYEHRHAATPFGRLGTMSEHTRAVLFALDPDAGYTSGSTIYVDGAIRQALV